jgi:hypothetical protein
VEVGAAACRRYLDHLTRLQLPLDAPAIDVDGRCFARQHPAIVEPAEAHGPDGIEVADAPEAPLRHHAGGVGTPQCALHEADGIEQAGALLPGLDDDAEDELGVVGAGKGDAPRLILSAQVPVVGHISVR